MRPRRQIIMAVGAALGGAAALASERTDSRDTTTDASGELAVRPEGER